MSKSGIEPRQCFLPLLLAYMLGNWIKDILALTLLKVWLSVQPGLNLQTSHKQCDAQFFLLWGPGSKFIRFGFGDIEGDARCDLFLLNKCGTFYKSQTQGFYYHFLELISVYHLFSETEQKNQIISYGSEEAACSTMFKKLILEVMILLCSHYIYIG